MDRPKVHVFGLWTQRRIPIDLAQRLRLVIARSASDDLSAVARRAKAEAIHCPAAEIMDCFASLAMTAEWLFENRIRIDALLLRAWCAPSPRLRGGGRGQGDSPRVPLWRVPLTRAFGATSPRKRGEVKRDYILRRAAAADASTTLSTSSRQRTISIASTGWLKPFSTRSSRGLASTHCSTMP